MATFTATGSVSIHMSNVVMVGLYYASITISTATQIRASWSSTGWMDFYGNFSYSNGNVAGVINRAAEVTGGVVAYEISGISIDAGTFVNWINTDDVFAAKRAIFSGNDVISGSNFSDYFEYTEGIDYIDGKGDADILRVADGYVYSSSEIVALREGELYRLITHRGEVVLKDVEFISYSPFPTAPLSSLVFDAMAYAAASRDLALVFGTNTVAAARHYVSVGRNERRPTSGFDALQYLAANADLHDTFGMNSAAAVSHWLAYGVREGRSNTFNAVGYLAGNRDLLRAYGTDLASAVRHYLIIGRAEGRTTTSFNAAAYLAANPDLVEDGHTVNTAASHYVYIGFREGRPLSPATLAAG